MKTLVKLISYVGLATLALTPSKALSQGTTTITMNAKDFPSASSKQSYEYKGKTYYRDGEFYSNGEKYVQFSPFIKNKSYSNVRNINKETVKLHNINNYNSNKNEINWKKTANNALIIGGSLLILNELLKPRQKNHVNTNLNKNLPKKNYNPVGEHTKDWWEEQSKESEEIWGESRNKLDKTKKTASYIIGQKIKGGSTVMEVDKILNKGPKFWWEEQSKEAEEIYGGNKVNKNINTSVYIIGDNIPYGKKARKVGEKIGEGVVKVINWWDE